MEMAVEHINKHFTPLFKTLSPNVANIQLHTIICAPNQIQSQTRNGYKHCGSFEFYLNSGSILTISMSVGTMFAYSGFLLTHRQQIRNKDSQFKPFVNIATYNSKKLFENMMASFRHYLEIG